MARVIGIGPDAERGDTVYDPTCGSGSLLIKAAGCNSDIGAEVGAPERGLMPESSPCPEDPNPDSVRKPIIPYGRRKGHDARLG